MSDYANIGYAADRESEQRKFLTGTYGWMAVALLISAAAAFVTAGSPALLSLIFTGWHYWVLIIGELALVWWLSASIRKISVAAAVIGFLADIREALASHSDEELELMVGRERMKSL